MRFDADKRDAAVADLKALMEKYGCSAYTLGLLARLVRKEQR